jgi:hypothetical protein
MERAVRFQCNEESTGDKETVQGFQRLFDLCCKAEHMGLDNGIISIGRQAGLFGDSVHVEGRCPQFNRIVLVAARSVIESQGWIFRGNSGEKLVE